MMGYNYRSPNYRRHRRGIYGFPWGIVFFVIILTNSWSFVGIAQWILGAVLLSLLINIIFRALSRGSSVDRQQQPYQTDQTSHKQAYQSYEQGYQPTPPVYTASESYQPPREQATSDLYQEYELPKAEYPEQLPPM